MNEHHLDELRYLGVPVYPRFISDAVRTKQNSRKAMRSHPYFDGLQIPLHLRVVLNKPPLQ